MLEAEDEFIEFVGYMAAAVVAGGLTLKVLEDYQKYKTSGSKDTRITETTAKIAGFVAGVVSPDAAYNLARSGRYGQMRASKASARMSWGEMFAGISDAELKQVPLAHFANLAKLAGLLDKVSQIWGGSLIHGTGAKGSAYRFSGALSAKGSAHKYGLAIDIKPPAGLTPFQAFLKLHYAKWPYDLGWNKYSNFVHIGGTIAAGGGAPGRWTYGADGLPRYGTKEVFP